MASFDGKEVLKEMLEAARVSLGNSVPKAYEYVEAELKKLAKEIAKVETNRIIGEIDHRIAQILTDSLINAAKTIGLTGKGIISVEAEKAINAALAVLKNAIKAVA